MKINLENCTFIGNGIGVFAKIRSASAIGAPFLRGGALSIATNIPTHVLINGSRFERNSLELTGLKSHATFGGAVDLDISHPNSSSLVVGSRFKQNTAFSGVGISDDASAGLCGGGAVNCYASHPIVFKNCSFERNSCTGANGGLYALTSGIYFAHGPHSLTDLRAMLREARSRTKSLR